MKKFFNAIGIFLSVILTIVLVALIIAYVLVLNIKYLVSKNNMTNIMENTNLVDTIKRVEDGKIWEDLVSFSKENNISEEQLTAIIENDTIKKEVAIYFSEALSSLNNHNSVNITKEDIEKTINIAVIEINKETNNLISKEDMDNLLNSIKDEDLKELNEKINSLNLSEEVSQEYSDIFEIVDQILYGYYSLIILTIIIAIILLLILFRFSYYKWLAYLSTSTIVSGALLLTFNIGISTLKISQTEVPSIILPLRNAIISHIYFTIVILFVIAIGVIVLHDILKKNYFKKKIKNT